MAKKKKNHNRDCAIALLKNPKIFDSELLRVDRIPSETIYSAPHGLGRPDLYGMFDVGVWLPEASLNVLIACSSHKNMAKSIREHDLKNSEKYIYSMNFAYYLVSWVVHKHRMVFRFYHLPDMGEIL